MNLFLYMYLFTALACNHEIQHLIYLFIYLFILNWLFVVKKKKKKTSGSGRVRALNLTVPLGSGRVGSDDLGYGPGSGFSFKPVQTSNKGTIRTSSGQKITLQSKNS